MKPSKMIDGYCRNTLSSQEALRSSNTPAAFPGCQVVNNTTDHDVKFKTGKENIMKKLLSLLLAATMLFALLGGCSSDNEPGSSGNSGDGGKYGLSDTITIICPVPAGGDTDRNTRILAQYMEKYAGVTVVVENIDGGATVMGMQECLDRSERNPNGTTLVVNGTDIFVPYMQGTSQLTIDSFKTVTLMCCST